MSNEKKIDSLRGRHDKKRTQDDLNNEEFLIWTIEELEGKVLYLRDRLEVERLSRGEAVRRRALIFPTVLAFERDPEFSGE